MFYLIIVWICACALFGESVYLLVKWLRMDKQYIPKLYSSVRSLVMAQNYKKAIEYCGWNQKDEIAGDFVRMLSTAENKNQGLEPAFQVGFDRIETLLNNTQRKYLVFDMINVLLSFIVLTVLAVTSKIIGHSVSWPVMIMFFSLVYQKKHFFKVEKDLISQKQYLLKLRALLYKMQGNYATEIKPIKMTRGELEEWQKRLDDEIERQEKSEAC